MEFVEHRRLETRIDAVDNVVHLNKSLDSGLAIKGILCLLQM